VIPFKILNHTTNIIASAKTWAINPQTWMTERKHKQRVIACACLT